jgi:hypothetical protein
MGLARGSNIGALLGQTPLEEKAKGQIDHKSSFLSGPSRNFHVRLIFFACVRFFFNFDVEIDRCHSSLEHDQLKPKEKP